MNILFYKVILINSMYFFRLGAMGFLNFGNDIAPGIKLDLNLNIRYVTMYKVREENEKIIN